MEEAISISGGGSPSPELLLMRGRMLALLHRAEEAEAEYEQALLGARALGMRLFELQALTGVVELRRATGSTPDRVEELAAMVTSFSDGLGEHDVGAALDLLR